MDKLGFDAELAKDGQEALEKWRRGSFAALITDCHMPEMDGYALARKIREIEKLRGETKTLPIIACTASALAEEIADCMAAGMNEVLVKPLNVATLKNQLDRWFPAEDASPLPKPASIPLSNTRLVLS